jgi:hypothetical protein
MARFYSNENFPLPPVSKLPELGHDIFVVCSIDADFEALARRIDGAVSACADLAGMQIRVNRPPVDRKA